MPEIQGFPFTKSLRALAALLVFAAACAKSAPPVAEVASSKIDAVQFGVFQKTVEPSNLAASEALAKVVDREVAFLLGQKKGLLKGPGWDSSLERSRRDILAEAFMATQPGPAAFTEDDARNFYRAHSEERHLWHVLLGSAQEADLAKARLGRGDDPATLAREKSIDPSAKENGGDLGWIRRGQTVPNFEEAAFGAATGVLLGPVKTEFGWHVLKVLDARSATDEDFAKNKAAIMAQMEQTRGKQSREKALEALRKRYPLVADGEVLDMDRTTEAAPGDEARVAGRVAETTISLGELKAFLSESMRVSGQGHSLGAKTKEQYMEFLADDIRLAAAAKEAGLDRKPEVRAALWNGERQAAFSFFSEDFLKNCAVPEAALVAHHAANPDRFSGPGEVKLLILIAAQESIAQQALLDATRGVPWAQLYSKYANRESTGDWDLGWVPLAQLQTAVAPEALRAIVTQPLGRPLGPFPDMQGSALFQVADRRPGEPLPLEACKVQVREDYVKEHAAALLEGYLRGEGRKGMEIRTFPENLPK